MDLKKVLQLKSLWGFISKSAHFKNAYWSVADVVVYPFFYLFTTPFFLHKLGLEQYGLWMLINSLVISLGFLNVGLGDATIRFVAKYRALGDSASINRIFRATFTISLGVVLAILLVIQFSAELIITSGVFKIQPDLTQLAIVSLRLAGIAFACKLVEQVFFAFFKGFERFDLYSKVSIVFKLVTLGISFLLVITDYGLVQIFLANALLAIIGLIVEVVLLRQQLPASAFMPFFDRDTYKEVFSFSFWSWFQTIILLVYGQLDRFLVAAFVGMEVLAFYSIGLLVINQFHAVFSAASSFIFPLISKKRESNENIIPIYYRMQFLVMVSSLSVLLFLIVFQDPLFTLWLGEAHYRNAEIFITLFLVYEAFSLSSIVPYYFMIGSGNVRMNTFFMFVITVVSSGGMFVLFHWMGQSGLIWAKIVAVVISLPFLYTLLHKRVLGEVDSWAGIKILLPCLAIGGILLSPNLLLKILFFGLACWSLYYFYYRKVKLWLLPSAQPPAEIEQV